MKIRIFILTVALAALPMAECLADGVRFLVVNGKDGTQTSFALADEPRISCVNGELKVVSVSRVITLSLADVRSYQFMNESAGIGEIQKDGKIQLIEGTVIFSGLKEGSKVSIYLQDGRLIKDNMPDANGVAIVNVSDLPKGILILHSNETNIKIINR